SVLDQSTTSKGRGQSVAIRESMELAQYCERLGYHRYWVSEHHASDSIVGTAPEVLMAAIAATTSRIRVGSAGVMLPHYSALKVAEQFRVLEAIAPGRIDLGVGRAPGSDRLTAYALNPYANAAEDFPRPVHALRVWALAADTEVEARRLLQTREFWRVGFEKGLRQPLVTPEFAASYSYTDTERATIEALRRKALVGTGDAVAARLRELAERLQLD